jgi:hypothetical protein
MVITTHSHMAIFFYHLGEAYKFNLAIAKSLTEASDELLNLLD